MKPVLCDFGNTNARLLFLERSRAVLRTVPAARAGEVVRRLRADTCCYAVSVIGVPNMPVIVRRRVQFVTAQDFALRMRFDYDVRSLGADRAANAYAVRAMYPGMSVAVVSAGTCLTLDLVRADGSYAGGLILPGVRMSLDVMHERTAALPLVETCPKALQRNRQTMSLARETRSAMVRGVIFGLHAAIERFVRETKAQQVVITGGDASLALEKAFGDRTVIVPELVLRGLAQRLYDTGILSLDAFQTALRHPSLHVPV